jgi:predicted ArsR family transcriptional regulator
MGSPQQLGQYKKIVDRHDKIVAHLQQRSMTVTEVAGFLNVSPMTIHRDMRQLCNEDRAHIAEYRGLGDIRSVPVYAAGKGESARAPDRKSAAMEAIRQGFEKRAELAEKLKPRVQRHWMDVALFGEYKAG